MSFFYDLSAQNHFIGFTVGSTWKNVSSENIFQNSTSRNGVIGGVNYEYPINDFASLEGGLLYEQRGFVDEISLGPEEFFKYRANLDYLSIPIKISRYETINNLFVFAKGGLVPAFLINGKITAPTFNEDTGVVGEEIINVTNEAAAFDVSGIIEVGGGYKISENTRFLIAVGYQHSLTSITNSNFFSDEKIRNRGVNLTFGLMFSLSSKDRELDERDL